MIKIKHNDETIKIKPDLPVIPLRDVVVFPHMIYPLLIGRNFTINALQEAMSEDKQIILLSQREANVDKPKQADLYDIGVIARVLQVMKMPNGTFKVLVEGLIRAKVEKIHKKNKFYIAQVSPAISENQEHDLETEALCRTVSEQFSEYIRLNRRVPDEVLVTLASINDYQQKSDTIAAHILQKIETKQAILEEFDIKSQFVMLSDILNEEIEILKIEQEIDGTVRESMTQSQREFYLQQQLKVIKDELGQHDEPAAEVDDLYEKLETIDYPLEVKTKAEEEIKKLSKMHPYSAEAGVVRSYLDWLLGIPWNQPTKDRVEFKDVKAILDADHFGLDKPKSRIVEHLAIIRLAGRVKGPILCLVGPPGVGKTSVGRSIANAMNRKFVRMSLGGVHDESEIRGHRRTYIGALPGRIIQALKKAGSSNPVFLLDEIDKIGKDFRGDPASALLEVLDPEQNSTFTDNYLEVEYDLSDTLFITTANSLASIPTPLRDRMEIISLPGYLDFEKFTIAQKFLVPKLLKELGLSNIIITFQEDALYEIIRSYTRESGVRELERQIGAVLRKIVVDVASGKKTKKLIITKNKIHKALGSPKFVDSNIKSTPTIGYTVGLAWTSVGGETLPVEVVPMFGKSKLTLTGSLGEVMRESAVAALSFIRKNRQQFGLSQDFYENLELHVHIPEGAVPKDGPSAGVTLTTALLSSLVSIPVRTDIAMTGEITLTGDVLPIGGLNEKLLAAKRNGINEIILPFKNKKDVKELSDDLLEGLQLHYVKTIKEVLQIAMVRSPYVKLKSSRSEENRPRI